MTTTTPILLVGGAGKAGRWAARMLRAAHPGQPLLIGGRDTGRARALAAELGHAEGVAIDLDAEDLGLGTRPVSAIGLFFRDEKMAVLRHALARGIPSIGISAGLHEIGAEVSTGLLGPGAAPVVLGAEWLVGATTVPAVAAAQRFARVDSLRIGALLDEQDGGGPAADRDVERLISSRPPALTLRGGAHAWLSGDDLATRFRALDGTEVEAEIFSPFDVLVLANRVRTPELQFRLAIGESSARRRGAAPATEIHIEIEGADASGAPLRVHRVVVHPGGQMPLTGLGTALVLERLAGLTGDRPVPAGLCFPFQLLETQAYFARLAAAGGEVIDLAPA
ncbi:NAD(P)-dependent oxidoreductase [Oceanicella sp. SM1341]|uniref:NAD(P)-dependent oxidoreductase n=1 Tax=Oceanicella sp. SM1341 TaxID=1548889 RepID=UPI000E48FB4B|nr:NAD(P)-dependent oxidoreductase [Oceanicella sp. SM1341]